MDEGGVRTGLGHGAQHGMAFAWRYRWHSTSFEDTPPRTRTRSSDLSALRETRGREGRGNEAWDTRRGGHRQPPMYLHGEAPEAQHEHGLGRRGGGGGAQGVQDFQDPRARPADATVEAENDVGGEEQVPQTSQRRRREGGARYLLSRQRGERGERGRRAGRDDGARVGRLHAGGEGGVCERGGVKYCENPFFR